MRVPFALAFCLLFTAYAGSDVYDYRYAAPAGADLAKLIDNPQVINFTMDRFWDATHKEDRISNYADSHAVFALPLAQVARILGSASELKNISPRVAVARVESSGDPDSFILYEEIVIDVLGFKSGYKFRLSCENQTIAEDRYGGRTRMLESVDGTMYEIYSSWYAQRVVIDGREYTYVRLYNRNGLRNPAWGAETVGSMFGPGELRDNLNKIKQVVQSRMK